MKTCHFCGNTNFRKKRVQYIYRHNGHFLIVNRVPCVECEFCGEQYFEARVLKKIEQDFQDIHFGGKKAQHEILVPSEDFVFA